MKNLINKYIYYTALLVWAVFSIIILLYVYANSDRSVYPLYYTVGSAWNAGNDLYSGDCAAYSYWPGFALIFALLARFPYSIGSSLWSLLSILSVFSGMYMLARTVFDGSRARIGWFLLAGLPLAFEGIFNQQSNALVTGASLLGMVCICRQRYMAGSLLMLFAGMSKIAPVAFAMLFLVMYPRQLWWRYILAAVILSAVPFIFADSGYVVAQHGSWFGFLSGEVDERWAYRDMLVLCELVLKGKITQSFDGDFPLWYRGLQLLGAGVLCLVCMWWRYVRHAGRRSILAIVAMSGSVWWLLLGPSTEIATCVAGVAAAGLGLILAQDSRCGRWLMFPAYICIALGASGDYEWNMQQLTTSQWIYGMLPFGALILYLWICCFAGKALALTIDEKLIR